MDMNWKFLFYVFIASFIGCNEPIQKVENTQVIASATQAEYHKKDTTNHFEIDLNYPVIDGELDSEAIVSINNTILEEFYQFVDQESFISAHQNLPENFRTSESEWFGYLTNSYSIHQADSFLFISFSIYQYYLGAAHGFSTSKSLKFNINNGAELELASFIKTDSNSLKLLQNQINKNLPDSVCWGLQSDSSIIPAISDFYFIADTIVFSIDDYELCPFAFGFPEMRLATKQLEPALITTSFTSFLDIQTVIDEGEIATH